MGMTIAFLAGLVTMGVYVLIRQERLWRDFDARMTQMEFRVRYCMETDVLAKSNATIRAMSNDVLAAAREVMATKIAAADLASGRMYAGAAMGAAVARAANEAPRNPDMAPALRVEEKEEATPPAEFDLIGTPPTRRRESLNLDELMSMNLPEGTPNV